MSQAQPTDDVRIEANIATIAAPIVAMHQKVTDDAMELAKATDIDCMDMRTYADSERRRIATARKALDERRMAFTRPIRELEQQTNNLFNPAIKALEQIESLWKQKIIAFDDAEAARRRKAEAEARAAAEAERKRIEAEQAAAAEEERKRAEAKRQEAQAAAAAGNTDHASELVNEAAAAEAAAAAIAEAPVHIPVPVVVHEERPKGASYRRSNWKARVVDPGKVPREYCQPDQKVLDALAKSSNGQAKIEGVEFYDAGVLVGR